MKNKKRYLLWTLVLAALAVLVYLQVRHWKTFDWGRFSEATAAVNWLRVLVAMVLIYGSYTLRAWRWKMFLKPVREVDWRELVPSQFIGFTGLALLGRPGELIRPYLISKRHHLTLSSQVAVWAVERIFDVGSVTLLFALLLLSHRLGRIPYFREDPSQLRNVRNGGYLLIGLVVLMSLLAATLRQRAPQFAAWVRRRLEGVAPHLAHHVAHRVESFGRGFHTIHDTYTLVKIIFASLSIWLLVGVAYFQVMHSYPSLHFIRPPDVVLLMIASMVGSLLQLPAIGGGSQLATISVLQNVFAVPSEVAVSAGILLWLVTFETVTPMGLSLAHREHVSLLKIAEESERAEKREANESG